MNIKKQSLKGAFLVMGLLLAFGLTSGARSKNISTPTPATWQPATSYTHPVITSFCGAVYGTNIALNWVVDEEDYLTQYNVQYSSDGETFENAGIICDAAYPQENYHYATLPAMSPVAYYRIEILTPGERAQYTEIIRLECDL